MSEQEYKRELERLRAENARLQGLSQASISVVKGISKKNGKTYITVKGIPGTGWGISAEPVGWQAFISQFDAIQSQVKAVLN